MPRTFFSSAVGCFSTRRSARALTLWTRATSSSTSASVISACRDTHSAASSVARTSSLASRKSDGYILIARARHAATNFSEQSVNSPSGSPSFRTSVSLVISVSSDFGPSAPGSRFSEAGSAVPSSSHSATRAPTVRTRAGATVSSWRSVPLTARRSRPARVTCCWAMPGDSIGFEVRCRRARTG
ncbi:hypothetical protein [Streptomyces sp. NPDC053726]|uniref:hypothetical protein n=1 Tax=Streptomyces sp. NPDC053726 TaxID=3365713 RepID=UPI0037CE8DE3